MHSLRGALRQWSDGVPERVLVTGGSGTLGRLIVPRLRSAGCYVASFNRPNLTYRVCAKAGAYGQILSFVRARPRESGIIYCQARKTAEALAGKLNAKVIVNDTEFSNPGEMPVAERRLLQDALAALLPNNLAVSANEARKIRQKKMVLAMTVAVIFGGVVYLWLHGFFG